MANSGLQASASDLASEVKPRSNAGECPLFPTLDNLQTLSREGLTRLEEKRSLLIRQFADQLYSSDLDRAEKLAEALYKALSFTLTQISPRSIPNHGIPDTMVDCVEKKLGSNCCYENDSFTKLSRTVALLRASIAHHKKNGFSSPSFLLFLSACNAIEFPPVEANSASSSFPLGDTALPSDFSSS